MDRLFLDANVLFSAAYRAEAGVTRLWSLDGAELVSSEYAIAEAHRTPPETDQLDRLNRLLEGLERTAATTLAPDLRAGLNLREKDWPIVAGALQARATHLITGDHRDFGPYFGRRLLGVLVQTPAAYLSGLPEKQP